jgi:hypothetical protein
MNPIQHAKAKSEAILDPIDRILAADDELIPSSGFLSAVMDRVREEAAAPAPIPFPWKRALPGMLVVAMVFGWIAFQASRRTVIAPQQLSLALTPLSVSTEHALTSAGLVALSLVLSLACWLVSRRMVRNSRLL